MSKAEVIAEARRRTEEGFFDRQETAREPENLHFDRVTLECGHSLVETESTRRTREQLGMGIRCYRCAEAWVEGQTAGHGDDHGA